MGSQHRLSRRWRCTIQDNLRDAYQVHRKSSFGFFSGEVADLQQPDGSIFFDRSDKYFDYVLQFLRSPEDFPRLSKEILPFVLQEALYFRVRELVDLLSD